MAFKKTLAQRLFNVSRISMQALTNCRVSSPRVLARTRIPHNASQTTLAHDPGDNGMFKRFLHRRAIFQNDMAPELRSVWVGDKLIDKLREIDISKNRIQLDGLIPPPALSQERTSPVLGGLTAEDTKKLLRVAQLELVKMRLRETEKSWMPYSEFVRICAEACADLDQGNRIAKALDESGVVIVLGNSVLLRPEQVAKAIGGLIPLPVANPKEDPRRKELEEMKKQKAKIDIQAESLVRRELWCGLGYLVVQTAAALRLTFWELSWDVMEPICFFFTSMYVIGACFFFLRTSREPTFHSLYESRFITKQKRLMKVHNFDIGRYNQLRRACDPCSSLSSASDHADK